MSEAERTAQFRAALQLRQVRQGLAIIRMANVDPGDRFHRELISSLSWCDETAMDGDLITAMQATTVHALARVGAELARAKVGAEQMMAMGVAEHRAAGATKAAAEDQVKSDEAYWLIRHEAERLLHAERYMRKLLELLQSTLDNHRTARADQRAADRWHAETAT